MTSESARATGLPVTLSPVELLLDAEVSDRAFRLWHVLHRYSALPLGIIPGRAALAADLRCSVDSIDRALAELSRTGLLQIRRRVRVQGGRVAYVEDVGPGESIGDATNEYVLSFDAQRGGRTAAAPRTAAAGGGRTGAARSGDPDPISGGSSSDAREAGSGQPEPELLSPGMVASLDALHAAAIGLGLRDLDGDWGRELAVAGMTLADVSAAAEAAPRAVGPLAPYMLGVVRNRLEARARAASQEPRSAPRPDAGALPATRNPLSPPPRRGRGS